MALWFQAKIKYVQTDEKGKQKQINETYLFDAVSYTDAETKAYDYVADNLPEFQLVNIKRMKINEIFFVENGSEQWFKAKVQYIVFDEKSQQDKKVPYTMYINAETVKEAYELLQERLGTVSDYIISDINATAITEVVPYEDMNDKLAAGRLRPLSEVIAEKEEDNLLAN